MTAVPDAAANRPSPLHVAIIMDGNGRWAQRRGLPRSAGHRRGAEAAQEVVRAAARLGVRYLTLYSFSSENWSRPADEVSDLMALLRRYLRSEVADLHEGGARLRVIGDREGLPADIVPLIDNMEQLTADNSVIDVVIALNYGSRQEIARAARTLAEGAASGRLDPSTIDEQSIERALDTADIPHPDVLIRTSGEKRISNFLLWQLAYAELIFTDTLWPDFGEADLAAALGEYHARERRFGGVGVG